MTLIDREGRLFGRLNLVDAAVAAFILLLLPIGYGTYLLFRPSRPHIDSVTRVEVTREERRIAGDRLLTGKLKVTGNGFNPMLRAAIGSTPALGFVFENPNSADVLVGQVEPGKHDLILYDGIQEVARAREAVEIQSVSGPSVRAYGWLTGLTPADAEAYKAGYSTAPSLPGAFRIVALGPTRPATVRAAIGPRLADLAVPGRLQRAAEIVLRCDWPNTETCTVGGEHLMQPPPIAITLQGGLRFEIDEISPPEEPKPAVVRVRVDTPVAVMKIGDRDATVSTSTAEITAIAGTTITLALGLHESREGWRYRGQLVLTGATIALRTDAYAISGTVIDVELVSR